MIGKRLNIKIPDNATLQEIIEMLNFCGLGCQSDDPNPELQKWLYKNKDWVKDGE